jgi:putative lipoic acid-binding regulatory protein
MTTLLEQAFTAATKLSQVRQEKLAELILQEIAQQQTTLKKPRMLRPASKGSGYTDTSINNDAVLAEFIYKNKFPV